MIVRRCEWCDTRPAMKWEINDRVSWSTRVWSFSLLEQLTYGAWGGRGVVRHTAGFEKWHAVWQADFHVNHTSLIVGWHVPLYSPPSLSPGSHALFRTHRCSPVKPWLHVKFKKIKKVMQKLSCVSLHVTTTATKI